MRPFLVGMASKLVFLVKMMMMMTKKMRRRTRKEEEVQVMDVVLVKEAKEVKGVVEAASDLVVKRIGAKLVMATTIARTRP